jgi:WD40 repeat protein
MTIKKGSIIAAIFATCIILSLSCGNTGYTSPGSVIAHPGYGIYSLAISPDGTILATGGSDNKLKIWSLPEMTLLKTFEGHTDWVYSLDFSLDGKRLVSGGMDGNFIIWDIENCKMSIKKPISELYVDPPMTVVFSKSGSEIISGTRYRFLGGGVKLFSSENGNPLKFVIRFNSNIDEGYKSFYDVMPCYSLAVNSKLPIIAAGQVYFDKNPPIMVFDIDKPGDTRILIGHTDTITSLAFSPDGKTLASGSMDKTVRTWNIETYQGMKTLEGHKAWISSVIFSQDGILLASSSWKDNRILVWSASDGKLIRTLIASDAVSKIRFSPDGSKIYAGCLDGNVNIFRIGK